MIINVLILFCNSSLTSPCRRTTWCKCMTALSKVALSDYTPAKVRPGTSPGWQLTDTDKVLFYQTWWLILHQTKLYSHQTVSKYLSFLSCNLFRNVPVGTFRNKLRLSKIRYFEIVWWEYDFVWWEYNVVWCRTKFLNMIVLWSHLWCTVADVGNYTLNWLP